jgi:hypothetical protein
VLKDIIEKTPVERLASLLLEYNRHTQRERQLKSFEEFITELGTKPLPIPTLQIEDEDLRLLCITYGNYIKDFIESKKMAMGCNPVCVMEFYNNEFQDEEIIKEYMGEES